MQDITEHLAERLGKLQADLIQVLREREDLDKKEADIKNRLEAVRTTLNWERVLQGRSNGKPEWLTLGVSKAVLYLKEQNPDWGFIQIRDHMIEQGYDFDGKNPGLSVNQALIRQRVGTKKS